MGIEAVNLDQQTQMLVQFLQASIAQRSFSQSVGYHQENGVTITDALGDKIVLPPSIMREFSVWIAVICLVPGANITKGCSRLHAEAFPQRKDRGGACG